MSSVNIMGGNKRRELKRCVSWVVLAALPVLVATNVQAQEAKSETDTAETTEVIVVGTRASLQSAIDRKRRANTTVDSIVAEDISEFPDKNIGEALQRVTGISLQRDFGEGAQVSIRGVEPDLNRVEINGVGVLSNNGSGGRAVSFQELAAELVASVDVYKGYTADMTEGGVGGTVSIRTRRPLELRKPLLAVTGSMQHLDLTKSNKFRGNLTASRKFLDNRLGILFNATFDDNDTRADFLRGTLWSRFPTTICTVAACAAAGLQPSVSGDFDNSPDKTFEDPAFPNTPTKADCAPQAQNVASACLAQWNDFVPVIPRYGLWERQDKRVSAMLSAQYRINDKITVFSEYQINDRQQHLDDYNFQFTATSPDRYNVVTYDRNGNPLSRYPGATPAVVDDNHNVIEFYMAPYAPTASTGTAGNFLTQNRSFDYAYRSQYRSAGFEYRSDNFAIDGLYSSSDAKSVDETNALTFNASIPNIKVTLSPESGAPTFTAPDGYSFNDPETFGKYALSATGTPFTTTAITSEYRPSQTDTTEDMLKLDLDYFIRDSFFTKFETGYQERKSETLRFSPGGYTTFDPNDPTRAPIYVQAAYINYGIYLDPTRTTSSDISTLYTGPAVTQTTLRQYMTADDIVSFIRTASQQTPGTFYGGAQGAGIDLPSGWFAPSYQKAVAEGLIDTSLYNHNLVRRAPGRNAAGEIVGTFDQMPNLNVQENIKAWYGQFSFEQSLFGMRYSGNMGVRQIVTNVQATGAITSTYRTVAGGAAGNPRTYAVTLDKSYTDTLPTFNLSVFLTDNLIGRFGYAKVMARPKTADMVPSGTCVINDYPTEDENVLDSCSIGNPALKPYRASQFDLNFGWYKNRDTLISVAFFYKDVESFILARRPVPAYDLFGDGELYNVTQPVNGTGAKIQGVEISAQTAFTFLPAPWDGLGVQANYTYSDAMDVGLFDTLTLKELPFPGLSKDTFNLIVYYDKGPINARLAYNARSTYMTSVGSGGAPLFRDPTGYLDGKATYRINKNFSVFAEGRNLTGEIERSVSGSIRMNDQWYSGKRYFVGFSYRN